MKKTRLWTAMIAAAALATGGLIGAAPASAAGTLNVGTGSITATLGTDQAVYFCDSSVSGSTCAYVTSLYTSVSSGTYTSGASVFTPMPFAAALLPAGTYTVAIVETPPPPASEFNVAFETNVVISGGGGGGGGTSSGAAASAPVEVSLSLDLATSGASCTEGSAATGVMGTWLALPGADDCTSQTTPDANLLGWATTADFPVEIAQRQIDNGWGTYELFNEEGRMTAVFIPAGQATFVSASNSLHPIWAS